MVAFEPRISGVRSNGSADCATTTPHITLNYKLAFWLFLSTIRLVHPKLHSEAYLNGKITCVAPPQGIGCVVPPLRTPN